MFSKCSSHTIAAWIFLLLLQGPEFDMVIVQTLCSMGHEDVPKSLFFFFLSVPPAMQVQYEFLGKAEGIQSSKMKGCKTIIEAIRFVC